MTDLAPHLDDLDRRADLLARQWDTPLAAHLVYLALNLKCVAERRGNERLAEAAKAFGHYLHRLVQEARGGNVGGYVHELKVKLALLHEFAGDRAAASPVDAPGRAATLALLAPPGVDCAELIRQLTWCGFVPHRVDGVDELVELLDRLEVAAVLACRPAQDERLDDALATVRRVRLGRRPLILLSPDDDFAVRLAAVRMGAAAVLPWPASRDELLETLAQLTPDRDQAPLRVLVVEEVGDLARYYADMLEKHGYVVQTVDHPARAFEEIIHFAPDAVLLDRVLSGCDGIEFARTVRFSRHLAQVPIVCVASEATLARRPEPADGIDAWLAKPVVADELLAALGPRAQTYRRQRNHASNDSLTGALTHSHLFARLDHEVLRAQRQDAPLVFAMLDLDDFSRVNAALGYTAGDRVLRGLVSFLRERLRRSDAIGRVGGEEFALILPDTPLEAAHALLDSLRLAYAQLDHAEGHGLKLSFSCGLAAWRDDLPDVNALASMARAALVRAQTGGGDAIATDGLSGLEAVGDLAV